MKYKLLYISSDCAFDTNVLCFSEGHKEGPERARRQHDE